MKTVAMVSFQHYHVSLDVLAIYKEASFLEPYEQSAFIKGRQSLDGPLILNEIASWCKAKKGYVLKVDFQKAYDSVRWDVLDEILKEFGFGYRWRSWVSGSLQSAMASILVNGSPTEEFSFHRGLRHGDPFSSFLFILVMESLHIKRGMLQGSWSKENVDVVVKILQVFHLAFGISINMQKSKLLGFRV
ncbi:RNA-directed DNA polymerase, eukaryota [Tanacetum coccineum]